MDNFVGNWVINMWIVYNSLNLCTFMGITQLIRVFLYTVIIDIHKKEVRHLTVQTSQVYLYLMCKPQPTMYKSVLGWLYLYRTASLHSLYRYHAPARFD